MLVKSVESKVPTVRAYDVAEIYRWVPDQVSTSSLDRGSKLRGVMAVLKLLTEARNRHPETFISTNLLTREQKKKSLEFYKVLEATGTQKYRKYLLRTFLFPVLLCYTMV